MVEGIAIEAKWYVVHTYSGYENKVKATLERIVENRGIQEYIQEVSVPMEEQVEIKDGKKKTTMRKIYPGYVLVKMVLTST
jgi:transcriptional antiterminator NusG